MGPRKRVARTGLGAPRFMKSQIERRELRLTRLARIVACISTSSAHRLSDYARNSDGILDRKRRVRISPVPGFEDEWLRGELVTLIPKGLREAVHCFEPRHDGLSETAAL